MTLQYHGNGQATLTGKQGSGNYDMDRLCARLKRHGCVVIRTGSSFIRHLTLMPEMLDQFQAGTTYTVNERGGIKPV